MKLNEMVDIIYKTSKEEESLYWPNQKPVSKLKLRTLIVSLYERGIEVTPALKPSFFKPYERPDGNHIMKEHRIRTYKVNEDYPLEINNEKWVMIYSWSTIQDLSGEEVGIFRYVSNKHLEEEEEASQMRKED